MKFPTSQQYGSLNLLRNCDSILQGDLRAIPKGTDECRESESVKIPAPDFYS